MSPDQPNPPEPSTPRTPRAPQRRSRLLAVLRLLLFVLVLGGAWAWLYRAGGNDPRAWLETLRSTNPWVFIALMALLPTLGFPIGVFYLFAGAVFGFFYGWLYSLIGLTASMSLGYGAARTFLQKPLEALLATWSRRIPALNTRHHIRAVLLVRIGPPYMIQNPLLAALGIPFPKYLAASLVAQGLIAMLMCTIGSAGRQPLAVTIALGAVAITGLCLIAHFGIRRNWRAPQPPATTETKD